MERWRAVKGAIDPRTDLPVPKPIALAQAEVVEHVAKRYGVLPGDVLAHDAVTLFHHLDLLEE